MMRIAPAFAIITTVALVVSPTSDAHAASWVDFASVGTPATPLRGLLARPDGSGPFPVVVLLHGCDGVRPYQQAWADALAKLGYAALLVDSFGSRHVSETCSKSEMLESNLIADAFGALAYLRDQPFVDSGHVGVMGWNLGGEAALSAVDASAFARVFEGKFTASVAMYPGMAAPAHFVAPVLLLLAADDDWVPSARTARFAKMSEAASQPIAVKIYPDAFQYFDDPDRGAKFYLADAYNPRAAAGKGATLGYSAVAANDAFEQVTSFFSKYLK